MTAPEPAGRPVGGEATPVRSVLVVPVADAARTAAAAALVRVAATAVPLDGAGTGLVLEHPGGAEESAHRVSRVLGDVELSLLERRGDQVDAVTWRAGQRTGATPGGRALACLPDVASRLVLGADPATFPGAVSTAGMSRVAAARAAVAGSRAEARWVDAARRWDRVAGTVVLVLLAVAVTVQAVRATSGDGSALLLGVGVALLGLLALRQWRRYGPGAG